MRLCREVPEGVWDREACGGAAPGTCVKRQEAQSPEDACGVSGPCQVTKPEEARLTQSEPPGMGWVVSRHGGVYSLVTLWFCRGRRSEQRVPGSPQSPESLPREEAWGSGMDRPHSIQGKRREEAHSGSTDIATTESRRQPAHSSHSPIDSHSDPANDVLTRGTEGGSDLPVVLRLGRGEPQASAGEAPRPACKRCGSLGGHPSPVQDTSWLWPPLPTP